MSKANPTPISDLTIKGDLFVEQMRSRKLFEKLLADAKAGTPLTEHEKNFVGMFMELSVLNDGSPDQVPELENYVFKRLCGIYLNNFDGGVRFYKPDKGKIQAARKIYTAGADIKQYDLHREVPLQEVDKDLDFLANLAVKWEKLVQITNHTNQILQMVLPEARQQLKDFDAKYKNPLTENTKIYKTPKRQLLLLSKYMYLMVCEVLETMTPADKILKLNGTVIEFNEWSLYHILMRHYAPDAKENVLSKSFLNQDNLPRQLHIHLSKIFTEIDQSGHYVNDSIKKVSFEFKGITYQVWTEEKTKSVAGSGNIRYNRVQSYYPVEKQKDLDDLGNNYNLKKVNNDLSVYLKK